MLTKLRREFVAITMALVGVVLIVALGSTLLASVSRQRGVTNSLLEYALDGQLVPQFGDSSGRQGADTALTMTVEVSADGTVRARGDSPARIPADTLYDVIVEVLSSDQDSGQSADYPIAWMRTATGDGFRIALADTYSRDAGLRAQATTDLVIVVVSMGTLYVVAWLLSGWVLRPVRETWERQRRFISDASHELKTPLAVIVANTQILDSERDLPEASRRWVKSTSEEASHMKSLVEDLLTLARADEGRSLGSGESPMREDVDLTALVEGCALEFDAVAFERGCSIECDLAPQVHLTGDPSQLGRMVRTLVDNATKYAQHGTPVRVRLAYDARHVRLTVSNAGEPIAAEDLGHLFDRFYRTDSARARQENGGFGLGLAIAKSVVEAHGGKISAASTPEGITTFTVLL